MWILNPFLWPLDFLVTSTGLQHKVQETEQILASDFTSARSNPTNLVRKSSADFHFWRKPLLRKLKQFLCFKISANWKGICSDCKFPLHLNQVSPMLLSMCSYWSLQNRLLRSSWISLQVQRQNRDLQVFQWPPAGWPAPWLLLLTTSQAVEANNYRHKLFLKCIQPVLT